MKRTISSLVVIALIVLVGWLVFWRKGNQAQDNTDQTNQTSQTPNSNSNQGGSQDNNKATDSGNAISGRLQVSDNKSLGNLMIVEADHTVYLSTSRDFSSLIGQNVVATIDGNLQSFTLLDIQPAQ